MPRSIRVRLRCDPAEVETAVAALVASGFGGAELADGEVAGYVSATEAGETALAELAATLRRWPAGSAGGWPVEREEIGEEAWAEAWKDHWRPSACGVRLWIVPSWCQGEVLPEGALPLRLDPGMAFGTGEHASTRLALVLLEQAIAGRRQLRVLDAGCGSGILTVAAARLGAGQVLAVNSDPVATAAAVANAARNGVSDRVEVRHADAVALGTALPAGSFDLILANILAEVLVPLASGVRRLLARDGEVILSGIVAGARRMVLEAYAEHGLRPVAAIRLGDWCALRLARGGPAAAEEGRRA